MNTKTKATVATIGLGALVLSGGTLALWQGQADLNAAQISTGHLSIASGDVLYFDVSELKLQEDVGDEQPGHPDDISPGGDGTKSLATLANHAIDITTFEATPGDTILVVQKITPQLRGHNLLAQAEIVGADGNPVSLDVTYTYTGTGTGDGVEAFSVSEPEIFRDVDEVTGALEPLEAANAPTVDGRTAWVFTQADHNQNLFVAYEVTFGVDDGAVGDTQDAPEMDATVSITDLAVKLTQVRTADL